MSPTSRPTFGHAAGSGTATRCWITLTVAWRRNSGTSALASVPKNRLTIAWTMSPTDGIWIPM